jgi:hypothetical protein
MEDNKTLQQLGGLAVAEKTPPETCPRCGKVFSGKTWHSYLGHLGLHGLADNYFGGDIKAAQKRLQLNALARLDPAPWNNAWPRYQPIKETPMHEVNP